MKGLLLYVSTVCEERRVLRCPHFVTDILVKYGNIHFQETITLSGNNNTVQLDINSAVMLGQEILGILDLSYNGK